MRDFFSKPSMICQLQLPTDAVFDYPFKVFWIKMQKQICKMCNIMAFWPTRLHARPHQAPYCNIVKLFRKSCLLPVQGGGWRDLSPHPCWPWGADHGCVRMQRRLHLPKVGLSFLVYCLRCCFFSQNNSFTKNISRYGIFITCEGAVYCLAHTKLRIYWTVPNIIEEGFI